jgi:urease accessory protein UreE
MWCEKVLANLANVPGSADSRAQIDPVDLHWHECTGLLKKQTRAGEPIRVLLPRGQRVRHGDIVYQDLTRTVVIHVLPCEVIVATPECQRDFAVLALELGNLHLPTQVGEGELIFIEEISAMDVLKEMRISWNKAIRRFEPTAIVSAPAAKLAGEFRVVRQQK